jgi:iron complex transport system substrate-binding protein
MPLDFIKSDRPKKQSGSECRRIYICETGEIRLETRHMRKAFSPAEFLRMVRDAAKKRGGLPTVHKKGFPPTLSLLGLFFTLLLLNGCGGGNESVEATINTDQPRIVTVGGSVTETAYALGADTEIVGTDTSSIYPEQATKLPQVGYQRQLSSEGVLSLKPTHVLATSLAGIPTAIEQIRNAGVKFETIPNDNSVEGTKAQIRQIGKALNRDRQSEELIARLEKDLAEAKTCVDALERKPKVLFIHARGAAVVNVGGAGTAGDEMIKLAGGENVITEFADYKPLTAETIVSVAPEVILIPERSLASIGGKEGLLKMPGISATPAGKNGRIIAMDDLLLLGFTPRLGKALNELCGKLR